MYVILDLELECVWDTLKPTFLNDLVKLLSDCIKEQSLFTLDSAFSILANAFESDQFLCTEELKDISVEFPGNQSPNGSHVQGSCFNAGFICLPRTRINLKFKGQSHTNPSLS